MKIMEKKIISSKTLVILDAGHGIDTPGKRSPVWSDNTQLFEWEFNRDIVNKIIFYISILKISYVKLITNDTDMPLKKRVELINSIYKEHKNKMIYLVSVHGNAAPNPKANGIEVWTSKGDTKSDKLATYFYNNLKNLGWKMRPNNSLELDKESNFYLLKKTECPAVLTENGFYTNEDECKKMNQSFWRNKIALAHVEAIKQIENENIF